MVKTIDDLLAPTEPPKPGDVLSWLTERGVRYDVAGGYPRDIFYGRIPNDMDIWVYGPFDGLLLELMAIDFKWDKVASFYNKAEGADPEDPNRAMIDIVLCSEKVDVIFLNDKVTTLLQLVDRFDCSINRFVLKGGDAYYVCEDGYQTCVPPTRYVQQCRTNPAREAKMKEKVLTLTGKEVILYEQDGKVDSTEG